MSFFGLRNVFPVSRSAEQWDRQFTKGKWDMLIKDHRSQSHMGIIGAILLELTQAREGKLRVLDVGCGNGAVARWAWVFRDRCDYTGIDISQVALEKLRTLHPEATLHCADMHEPPALGKSFDVIVLAEVLYYGDCGKILDTYIPLLGEHGVFIISLNRPWWTRPIWHALNRRLRTVDAFRVLYERSGARWRIALCRPIANDAR